MSTPLTLGQMRKQAQQQIANALGLPSDEASVEISTLLQHCLEVNRAWLISHENDVLDGRNLAKFEALLKRRLAGEPIAYIIGKREFYGMEFKVTPDTLIPRPDTETLVEAALEKIPLQPSLRRKPESSNLIELDSGFRRNDEPRVLDLGTGTGAIAIAIAKHRPMAQVTAVEASSAALAVAQENARNLGIPNIRFVLSDWFDALQGQTFDVIASNPPYIAKQDPHLQQGDLRFEPVSALAAGTDGLDDIRLIISQARNHLNSNGWLLLEHGYEQGAEVAELMNDMGFFSTSTVIDIGGNPRVTLAKRLR